MAAPETLQGNLHRLESSVLVSSSLLHLQCVLEVHASFQLRKLCTRNPTTTGGYIEISAQTSTRLWPFLIPSCACIVHNATEWEVESRCHSQPGWWLGMGWWLEFVVFGTLEVGERSEELCGGRGLRIGFVDWMWMAWNRNLCFKCCVWWCCDNFFLTSV